MDLITISAFGQKYYYPRNLLIKSTMLSKAACTEQEINLRIPDELKPAFEWIYQRLTSVDNPEFPYEHFPEIVHLAKYMGIQTIIYDIYCEINNGHIDVRTLIRYYLMYQGNPLLRRAAIQQIVSCRF